MTVAFLLGAGGDVLARSERQQRKGAAEAAEKFESPHPLIIVVSTGRQHLKVYNARGRVVAEAPVSSGQAGRETPHGVFSILAKEQMHHSNLYDDAPMPWMERITWSGVALHAGNLPGYPASHGCIRLPHNFSRSLYGLTRIGTRVIVSRADPAPQSFAHPLLFAPLPTQAAIAVRTAPSAATTASADHGASSHGVEPAALLGISPAHASEVPHAMRTREQAAAERTARIASAKARLDAAQVSRSNLEMAARAQAEASRKAQDAVHDEHAENGRMQDARRKLLSELAGVKDDITELAKVARRVGDDAALEVAADREQQLEDQLDRLTAQVHGADAMIETQAELIAAAAANADAANARRLAAVADLKQAGDDVEAARTALSKGQREDANSQRPITVFVSRKTGKLYVRQGFDELFEAPVAIAESELPFGTHVFTASGEADDGMALTWTVTTVLSGQAADPPRSKKSRRKGKEDTDAVDPDAAAQASRPARVLERITVSPDVRARIAEFIKPGSSLIVSDNAASHETGRGTDFVILTR